MEITPKPYPNNAKKHSPEQIYKIALSVREFGWRQPIVVDKDAFIIVGHGRWLAYEKYKDEMGFKEPIIEVAEDLTEEQANAYRRADNMLFSPDYDYDLVLGEMNKLGDSYQEMLKFGETESTKKEDIKEEEFITDENMATYLARTIRQIVMHFSQDDFTDLENKCNEICKHYNLETKSELFKMLVELEHNKVITKTIPS